MATLSQLGVASVKSNQVLFTGEFEETPFRSRDGEAYVVGKLVSPVTIRCSTDPSEAPIEVDELYILESVKDSDLWDGSPEDGLFIPKFKTDLNKSHGIPVYQAQYIAEWVRNQQTDRRDSIKSNTAAKIEALRQKAQQLARPQVVGG